MSNDSASGRVAFPYADYASGAPDAYRCSQCPAHGVKLWRQYQTCADYIKLLCCDCAVHDQVVRSSIEPGTVVGDDGKIDFCGMRSDQIGWLVPAVPCEDDDTYWGYTSVPQAGVEWWKRLPTRSAKQ